MLRLSHIVYSSRFPLASTISRWNRSLCSTAAGTSARVAASAIRSTSACSADTSAHRRGVAIRAANSSSAARTS